MYKRLIISSCFIFVLVLANNIASAVDWSASNILLKDGAVHDVSTTESISGYMTISCRPGALSTTLNVNTGADVSIGSYTWVGHYSEYWVTGCAGTLHINGGKLTGAGLKFGSYHGKGILNISSGTLESTNYLHLGAANNSGSLGDGPSICDATISGGLLKGDSIDIGYGGSHPYNITYVTLSGGVIEADSLSIGTGGSTATLDICGGTLRINGDATGLVSIYVNQGKIIANGGDEWSIVNVEYDSSAGQTIVTAGEPDHTKAHHPYPADRSKDLKRIITLNWVPALLAADANGHDVYFGTSFDDVNNASYDSDGFLDRQDANSYDLTNELELNATYYWRIDEVNDPCVWKGDVWRFTVADFVRVDDFDLYDNLSELQSVWITADALMDGAMGIFYDAATEVTCSYESAQDWTDENVKALYIDFRGQASNGAEITYITLSDANNSGTVFYDGDANDLKIDYWKTWRINLQDFGIQLNGVRQVTIGFSNDLGGAGTVYFDRLRLHRLKCLDKPNNDLNGDCVVDFKDFFVLVADWLVVR